MVLPYDQPQTAAGTWVIADDVDGGELAAYRLYACPDIVRGMPADGGAQSDTARRGMP